MRHNTVKYARRTAVGGGAKPSFQRFAHAFRDHSRIVVDAERYGALESVPAGNEYAEPALERIGGDPPFVWRAGMLAAGDYRCLDSLAGGCLGFL
jgi:hypothetical protein